MVIVDPLLLVYLIPLAAILGGYLWRRRRQQLTSLQALNEARETGLTEPAPGYEYRCWVEIGGKRERIGRMFFGHELAYWAGAVSAIAGASSPTTFGVSLVDVSATTLDSQPVLVGSD